MGLQTGRKSPDDKFLHDVGEGGFTKPDQRVLQDQSHGIAIARRIVSIRDSAGGEASENARIIWLPALVVSPGDHGASDGV